MRRIKLSFSLLLLLFTLIPLKAFAGTENFYFDSFEADYYLSKDAEGISHLKVVENYTVVFQGYNQNKGICRLIPYTNQDGKNITLPSLTKNDIKLTRNGLDEPIYSIEKVEGLSYRVCTGDETYVNGSQNYEMTYNFERVITEFENNQELFWDTNGTGSYQKFNSVVARVHFADSDIKKNYTGKNKCYVGKYKEVGSKRCTVSEISDGLEFRTSNLGSFENLSYYIDFKPGSFVVPAPEKNYTLVTIMVGFGVICLLLLIVPFKNFLKTREKASFYKGIFVRPEYQPNKDYSVAEMAEVYIGDKKDAKVAVMLDMIVNGYITLIKNEGKGLKKDKWSVKVKKTDGLSEEGLVLLSILNGGLPPKVDDEFEIKTRTATSSLISLGRKYDKLIIDDLKLDGLVEKNYRKSATFKISDFIVTMVIIGLMVMPVIVGIWESLLDEHGDFKIVGDVVGKDVFSYVMGGIALVAMIIYAILKINASKFLHRTKKGLEASRYMDGLKLYIEMAEKDRLAFLQSVKGVDTSAEGVVHLYEKLLPYAAVLGLEKSWMKELEKYYKLNEVKAPDWYYHDMVAYNMLSAVNTAASVARSSTTYVSSGGGSSSGFSGGGGGGFSGGGGGGGGFSGR